MKDETLDSTYLFFTDTKWNQWRMLLERRTTGYTWCTSFERVQKNGEFKDKSQIFKLENDKHTKLKTQKSGNVISTSRESMLDASESDITERGYLESSSSIETSGGQNDETTSGRSRLSGLKQLSFAHLANIRQKINEGRKFLASSRVIGTSNELSSSDLSNSQGSISHGNSKIEPEALNCKVGGARLSLQQASCTKNIRGQGHSMVLGGLVPEAAILTLNNIDLEVLPQVS